MDAAADARFGALRATRKGPEHFPERLCEIHAMLSDLIEEFEPQGVAVESVFTALNMRRRSSLPKSAAWFCWRRPSAMSPCTAIPRAK